MLVLLLLTASAQASQKNWQDRRAQTIAVAAWGEIPGCPTIAVQRGLPPAEGLTAWVPLGLCEVWFSSLQRPLWPTLCTMMIHEYGHLAGEQHSADPGSVMYERHTIVIELAARGRIRRVRGADPRCYNRGRAILGLRGRVHHGWN